MNIIKESTITIIIGVGDGISAANGENMAKIAETKVAIEFPVALFNMGKNLGLVKTQKFIA